MKVAKQYYLLPLFLILQIVLLHTSGCTKEYSYEWEAFVPAPRDTVVPPKPEFPLCSLCKVGAPLQEGKWSFKTGNSFLCGEITDGIITSDKSAFTFFGPSACSEDSGLVITAYPAPVTLETDMFNLTITKTAFFYYDHNATYNIFISRPATPFTVTIQSYISATGIATGTFNGTVYKANGEIAHIDEGKFKVKLHQ
ncbi:MAG: hypothetical protein ABJA37_15065 [Ferruginibacter sp.]